MPVFAFPDPPQQFLIYPPIPLLSSALPKEKKFFLLNIFFKQTNSFSFFVVVFVSFLPHGMTVWKFMSVNLVFFAKLEIQFKKMYF